jgi:hypothetical protein
MNGTHFTLVKSCLPILFIIAFLFPTNKVTKIVESGDRYNPFKMLILNVRVMATIPFL